LRFSMDSLVVEETEIVWMERGDFRPDAPPVVDVQLEMTVEDLADKMNFIRCYSDLVPKRKPVFEWDYWFPYYVKKFEAKRRAGAGGGATFSAIARKSRPEFVSHRVLECL